MKKVFIVLVMMVCSVLLSAKSVVKQIGDTVVISKSGSKTDLRTCTITDFYSNGDVFTIELAEENPKGGYLYMKFHVWVGEKLPFYFYDLDNDDSFSTPEVYRAEINKIDFYFD